VFTLDGGALRVELPGPTVKHEGREEREEAHEEKGQERPKKRPEEEPEIM
jgi:hypothetical protein